MKRAAEILDEKAKRLSEVLLEFKLDTAAWRMQTLRAEHFRKQYDLAAAVTAHVRGRYGTGQQSVIAYADEVDALRRKTEAEHQCINERARAMETGDDMERMTGELHALEKDMADWAANADHHAEELFRQLKRQDIDEQTAFYAAGLDCPCSDDRCEYPYAFTEQNGHGPSVQRCPRTWSSHS